MADEFKNKARFICRKCGQQVYASESLVFIKTREGLSIEHTLCPLNEDYQKKVREAIEKIDFVV